MARHLRLILSEDDHGDFQGKPGTYGVCGLERCTRCRPRRRLLKRLDDWLNRVTFRTGGGLK